MGEFKVYQRTKDGFFNATSLMKQWNVSRGMKKEINDYLENKATEEFIEELDSKIAETEALLSSEEVISNYEKLVELTKVLEDLQAQQEEAYSTWEELQD